jgi:outer membrane protein assembly factor BamD (BamD/ComL family)
MQTNNTNANQLIFAVWIVCLAMSALLTSCNNPEKDFHKAEKADTEQAYNKYIERYPDSPLVETAKRNLARVAYENAKRTNSVAALETFLSRFPSNNLTTNARTDLENLEFQLAVHANTESAWTAFLSKYTNSTHVASERENPGSSLIEEAKERLASLRVLEKWSVELVDCRAASLREDTGFGSGVSIEFGSGIQAEYLKKGQTTPDNGLHVQTYTWNKEALDKSTRDAGWNDLALAVQNRQHVTSTHLLGVLATIQKRTDPGTCVIDWATAELTLTNGNKVRPSMLFITDISPNVTGTIQGCLFKGAITLGNHRFTAVQSGPPYEGCLKLSLPQTAVDYQFAFEPQATLSLGLLFLDVDEASVKEITLLGAKLPLPRMQK